VKSGLLRLLPLLLLAGCARRQSAVESGRRMQVLHRGISYEVAGLDPQLATGISEGAIATALFEGLVAEDPKNLHPVPGVAESWDASADGLTYTFHLRADARWSNGQPVTAGDFVASWRRILSPALAAPNAALLYVLQGAEAYHHDATRDFSQVGVAAPDARTLRVTLDHAAPDFLARLTHWAWLPVYLPAIEAQGGAEDRGNAWARPGRLVGDGAFLLQSWAPDREIVLARSPTYWDAKRVALREIHLYPIDSVETEERAFRSGQLHVTDAVPVSKIEAYRRDAPQLLRIDPYLGTYYYALNVRRPGFGDSRVRRALSLAIDRGAIAARILHGVEQPASAFTPPGIEGYAPPEGARSDPAEARRLLAEAGHPGGQGLPQLELMFNSSENHRVIAEAVQDMWRRELGVQVKLVNEENKVVLAARQSGDFQIVRASWIADYPSPSSFLDLFRRGNGNNFTGWTSPEYDALLFAADRTADPAARRELWAKAEALLLEAAPVIPIYHYSHAFLIQPSVQGWYPNALDHHPYKYVWLDGK